MTIEERLARVRELLTQRGLDGWLFVGGPSPDPALGAVFRVAPPAHATRLHAYFVPADGEPVRLHHAIEPEVLAVLPGADWRYPTRAHWEQALTALFEHGGRVAVQYSPRGALPRMDAFPAGLMELAREHGLAPVSSAPLLGELAALSPTELAQHERAAGALTAAVQEAFAWMRERLTAGAEVTERSARDFLSERMRAGGLAPDAPPLVAFGEHTADPHYAPGPGADAALLHDELVLLDAWGRLAADGAPYADITWMGVTHEESPHEWGAMFEIVLRARDAGVEAVAGALKAGKTVTGAHVDEVVRGVIEAAGYRDYFLHRTGHCLGTEVHGLGVNLDSVEAPDDRPLPEGGAFTIEPGVYMPGRWGMRSEIDVVIAGGAARVTTTPFQRGLHPILG